MTPIIEIKNISKKYRITHQNDRYVALRDVLMNILRSPLKLFEAKKRMGANTKEDFWALKDINFTVNKGEVIGIIGGNGAGKSTLLKILSQITPPTTGEIIINGTVGSLLEVGTGFHPELTGRENIFLNGAILGMTKKEISKKFDAIVEFAGIDKFLDTPVKHYSSGMYVRLAFSVAAHMEPDILIIDEVLAVGDAEFQKKCLGKMDEITKKDGRTILFVSHNMTAVRQLCKKSMILSQGKLLSFGETDVIISEYLKSNAGEDKLENIKRRGHGKVRIVGFRIENKEGINIRVIENQESVFIFKYECPNPKQIGLIDLGFSIYKHDKLVMTYYSSYNNQYFQSLEASGEFRLSLPTLPLSSGNYSVGIKVFENSIETDCPIFHIGFFEVLRQDLFPNHNIELENEGCLIVKGDWSINKL